MKLGTLCLVVLLVAIGAIMWVARPASGAAPVRILVLGDSITQSAAGHYSWRYRLDRALHVEGVAFDLVGPQRGQCCTEYTGAPDFTATPGVLNSYADNGFDQDHASRWGVTMWQMLDDQPSDQNGWSENVGTLVAQYQPDIVISQLGVNDLNWGWNTPAGLVDQAQRLIDQVRAAKADTDVVVGALSPNWDAREAEYNSLIGGLEAGSTDSSRIVATHLELGTPGADTYDGIHPSDSGEVKIANAVGAGLRRLGVEAAVVPPVKNPSTTPKPTPERPVYKAPRAARLHLEHRVHKIRLTWTRGRSTSANVLVSVRHRPWKRLASTSAGRLDTFTFQGSGSYRWKVRLFNHGKASRFSNVVKVRL